MFRLENTTRVELNENLSKIRSLQGLSSERLLSQIAGEIIVNYYQNQIAENDVKVTRQFMVEQTNTILKDFELSPLSYTFFRKFKF